MFLDICVKCNFRSTKSSNDKEFSQIYPALQQYIVSYSRAVTQHAVTLAHSLTQLVVALTQLV